MKDKITCPVCGDEVMEYRAMDLYVECVRKTCLMNGVMYIHGRSIETTLRAKIAELEAYTNKLAAGLPEGMLPKDVENLREANAIMAQQVHDLKARCTWKRALDVTPPLERNVIVQCYFQGIIRARFEIIDGKLRYRKPHDNYYSPVTNETCWIDMPDMPEVLK